MAYTLVYDIGKSRYINLTNACTLKCTFCPKNQGDTRVHEHDLSLTKQPSANDIILQLGDLSRVEEVVFCGYGESTLRLPELLSISAYVKSQGIPVRLNTDGLGNFVHKRNILPELSSLIDKISISLNAQSAEVYEQHCQPNKSGAYDALRAFIAVAPDYFDHVDVSAIDGLEGVDILECQKIAETAGAHFKKRVLGRVG